MELSIESARGLLPDEEAVEIVERKGLGHPDTICDSVMDAVGRGLCRAYLDRFGFIPHHNCDKGSLVAGQVEVRFGGGRVLEPMRLVLGDRATTSVAGKSIDVAGIAIEEARSWFRRYLPRIDPERHVQYQVEFRPGSEELASILAGREGIAGANDTSAAVGYAPATETERLVLGAERYMNSAETRARFPECGEDVKVMGVRSGRRLELTACAPLVDRHVANEAAYFDLKEGIRRSLERYVSAHLRTLGSVEVRLNNLDRRGAGTAGMYLSVLGTSAEHGDSGQVGRGNAVNGLISLHRPQNSETAAGKNPVSHVGKIYSVLAFELAERICSAAAGVRGAEVRMCSRVGDPIDSPWIVSVRTALAEGTSLSDVRPRIEEVVRAGLDGMPEFCRALVAGRYEVC